MAEDLRDALSARIGRIERTNRILMLDSSALAMAVIYSLAVRPRTVQAEAFRLLAHDGAVRAELVLRNDEPGLYLKDQGGGDRVAVFHDSSTSGVYVFDSAGTTRIGVAQFSHGGGGFALHGPDSKGAAVLYLKGDGSLRFFDAEGKVTNQKLSEAK